MNENVKNTKNGIIPADQHLLELIPLYNKVQDCFNALGQTIELNLPQIVVIGSQSSGKSSVVESLIGRDILPRGTGIVTRCPVTLHLYHVSAFDGPERYEFVYSDNRPSFSFTDPENVRPEIERETNRLADGKNISQTPIVLNIYSPSVLTFSLVDLPGLFKNIQVGQSESAAQDVDTLIRNYVKNPNAIILVVWPADNDLATSEALQLAKEYDPEGQRTMVVLTKLDIMNPGTDAKEVLDGKTQLANKLQLGICGVVGRSQDDINNDVSVHDAKRKEEKFLRTHYPEHLDNGQVGAAALGRILQHLLLVHICKAQSDIEQQVTAEIEKLEKTLQRIGCPIEKSNYMEYLMNVIRCFVQTFQNRLEGNDVGIEKYEGGSEIHLEFFERLPEALNEVDVSPEFTTQKLEIGFANFQGVDIDMFGNSKVMARFLRPSIEKFQVPSEITIVKVAKILREIVSYAAVETRKEHTQFGTLVIELERTINSFIDKRLSKTKKALAGYVAQEKSMMNFYHPFCIKLFKQLVEHGKRAKIGTRVSSSDSLTELAVREKLINKAICGYTISNPLNNVEADTDVAEYKVDSVQNSEKYIAHLINSYNDPTKWEKLLKETDDIVSQRKRTKSKLEKTKDAAVAIRETSKICKVGQHSVIG